MDNITPKFHIWAIFLFKKFILCCHFVFFITLFNIHSSYPLSTNNDNNDAFLNVCNSFYPEEDEQSSKSDDKIGKEKKKETNKKDATENSLENKEKLTSKDKSSS